MECLKSDLTAWPERCICGTDQSYLEIDSEVRIIYLAVAGLGDMRLGFWMVNRTVALARDRLGGGFCLMVGMTCLGFDRLE